MTRSKSQSTSGRHSGRLLGESGRASLRSFRQRDRLPLLLFIAALAIVALGGGSNRTDVESLLFVRPCLVLILAGLTLLVRPDDLLPYRWPLSLAALGMLLIVVQLIPLPPALWTLLPGRALAARAFALQGLPLPWQPWSLTPDLTLQAGLWFLSPATALLGWACLPKSDRPAAVLAILAFCMTSALLGGLQASSGFLYLYERTYEGNAVGLLANRNHQGALLALAFPLLRVATLLPARSAQTARLRLIAAGLAALTLVPMILLTASRAGVALGVLGIVLAGSIAPWRTQDRQSGPLARYLPVAMIGALVAVMGRALSLTRLFSSDVESDLRVRYAPQVLELVRTYFPAGSGFGSFDTVFRAGEPDAFLKPTFFNHAHNDWVEIVLTAGLPGFLLLTAGLGWWLARGWALFRTRWGNRATNRGWADPLARAGWGTLLILMLASVADYPLRTPLLAFVFAAAACWAAGRTSALQSSRVPLGFRQAPAHPES